MKNDTPGVTAPKFEEVVVAKRGAPLPVTVPVLLRALASYLEVTGEADKFTAHLLDVLRDTDLDDGELPKQKIDDGELPKQKID